MTLYRTHQQKPVQVFTRTNPLEGEGFEDKVKILEDINAYARAKDNRVRQVSIGLSSEWQAVAIIRLDGQPVFDMRPLRLDVSVVAGEGDRQKADIVDEGVRIR